MIQCPRCHEPLRKTLLPTHVVICDHCGWFDSSVLYFLKNKQEAN